MNFSWGSLVYQKFSWNFVKWNLLLKALLQLLVVGSMDRQSHAAWNDICRNRYVKRLQYPYWYNLWHNTVPICRTFSDHLQELSIWYRWLLHLKSTGTRRLLEKHVQAIKKEYIKALYYWPFVRGIHWWTVDSPHKRSVLQNVLPYHDDIMIFWRGGNW